jgi:1-acyl-sn-glycerol-3-phosphate acyltransferase
MRYPVSSKYIRNPIGMLIRLFGGYDIGLTPLERAKKLLYTRDLIHNGYTVLLFPEGKINNQGLGEFQRGMDMLIQEDIPILLVRIYGMNARKVFKKVRLKFSNVITGIGPEDKARQIAEFFS